jgi:hypothetical protein
MAITGPKYLLSLSTWIIMIFLRLAPSRRSCQAGDGIAFFTALAGFFKGPRTERCR